MLPVMGSSPMSSLLGQPAPLKWVRLNSWIWVSLNRYPDGDAVGVSGLNCTMPKGSTGPGTVLPPAPPGTGLGELLSSEPMNGFTCCVSGSTTACAGVGEAAMTPPAISRVAAVFAVRERHRPAAFACPVAEEGPVDMTLSSPL